MMTLSKPLSASQAQTYHVEAFSKVRENYYTAGDRVPSAWHGRLAQQWGLDGAVDEARFSRLANGQYPVTGEPLVRHQTPRRHVNSHHQAVTTMEHRAGWDATFSAPKSVSLTALVGGDERVRAAHEASVAVALDEAERFVQARLGGNRPAETTAQWVAARFEHDSARPVGGYAAPQLHTHVVIFNLTQTEPDNHRPLQPRELYKAQQYTTAVYRSELAWRVRALGYDVERGSSGQPEIRGYTTAYVEASSPRRQQIRAHLVTHQLSGAGAAQIAAHQTREPKQHVSAEDMRRAHQEMAAMFGDQPTHVVERARALGRSISEEAPRVTAHAAVTFARDRNFEREAVNDERALLRDALQRSMGEVSVEDIKGDFERRVSAGEFIGVTPASGAASRSVTTQEMQDLERDTIGMMLAGQHGHEYLGDATTGRLAHEQPQLSDEQQIAVGQMLGSRDRILALDGVAGAGKTTVLSAVQAYAAEQGYIVEGLAPTSRAVQKLAEAGIASGTLQGHLARSQAPRDARPRLYVLDEASLASTRQLHALFRGLAPDDRVLLVGDVRQHHAVEAGRPYHQLQDAGMDTARLDTIVRQKDAALKAVVEQLARGEVMEAIGTLHAQGRVHEIPDGGVRLEAIATEYLKDPNGTLVVSPDNQSRMAINDVIHRAMQEAGHVDAREQCVHVLSPRQDVTGADRQWAERYAVDDVVRYTKGSRVFGMRPGDYARVEHVNGRDNLVTVARVRGERITYDPRRLQGVALYREADRAFSQGDRVQFTARDRQRGVANRELGIVERIEKSGRLHVRLDTGRMLALNAGSQPHLDYGYAITSHSSQGQTADRVLVHIDSSRASDRLLNRRLAYVALSRGRHDAQIYTNDTTHLAETLSRDVEHRSAIETSYAPKRAVKIEESASQELAAKTAISQGLTR